MSLDKDAPLGRSIQRQGAIVAVPICQDGIIATRGYDFWEGVRLTMVNLRVVDIYHGDRVSSFKKAADFGIWGIIDKATTGATGKDAKYPIRPTR